jgi:UDP-3-O-[3-hydroxymyristoyl] glucosamine N-acyltransferase
MELTVAEIAEMLRGEAVGEPQRPIRGVAAFDSAGPDDITFAMSPKFEKKLTDCAAGAVLVSRKLGTVSTSCCLIRVDSPQLAFARLLPRFYPQVTPVAGINPSAQIGEDFTRGDALSIAAFSVLGNRVTCGDRVTIHPCVVIGDDVTLGDDVLIYPNVTILSGCRIGNRVTIHAGTVIGSDGFGFAPDAERYQKIPQVGTVQIDDDVEIGAVNTIDRAALGKTWIQRGVKTDNLVHVAHNVTVGENTILVAQAGIAGSTTIGRHAIILGKAGVSGHLHIGDNAIIGNMAGVAKDVSAGEIVSGAPAMAHRTWLRVHRELPHLPEMKKKMTELEKRLAQLESRNP